MKVFLSLLALASAAWAQCDEDITATSQSDLDALSSCTSFNASIEIEGDYSGTSASFPGVTVINGDVRINNATQLTSLSFPSLEELNGEFFLQSLTRLNQLSAPELTTVSNIRWTTLPALSSLSFGSSITDADEVSISDTNLESLNGISLESVGILNLDNNRFLRSVDMQLEYIEEALTIAFNGQQVSVSFPNLRWANNVTYSDVNSLSMPSLSAINNSMSFINNTFSSLNLTNLTSVGSDLAIVSNIFLTEMSFPELEEVGGALQVANNTLLETIDAFDAVETVGGAVDFTGTFTNATLPSLERVRGGFNLQTNETFDCTEFEDYESNGVIQGAGFECSGQVDDPTTRDGSVSSTTETSTGTASGSGTTSSALAVPLYVPTGTVGIVGLLVAMLF